jgi:hypothetical protein
MASVSTRNVPRRAPINAQTRPSTPSPRSPTTARQPTAATTLPLEELKHRLPQLILFRMLAHAEEFLSEPIADFDYQ